MAEPLSTSTEAVNETVDQAAYEAEMVAKAEAAEANSMEKDKEQFGNEPSEEEQELLAGKYKSPEELEKAYKELEARLGKQDEAKEETTEETKDTEVEAPTNQEEAKELAESKGLDFTELNAEYADNGELSQETYKRLSDAGIDKATVDAYIAGQEALAEQNVAKLQNAIGGEGEFNSMVEWAAENLTETEKQAFNKMVSDEATAEFAIKGLHSRYKAEAEPNLLDGNVGNVSNRSYMSQREMVREMADPRYKTDSAYRKMVEQKIARSKF